MPGDLQPRFFKFNRLSVLMITVPAEDDVDLRQCSVTGLHYQLGTSPGYPWAYMSFQATSATHATLILTAAQVPISPGSTYGDVSTGELTVSFQNDQGGQDPQPVSAPVDTGN